MAEEVVREEKITIFPPEFLGQRMQQRFDCNEFLLDIKVREDGFCSGLEEIKALRTALKEKGIDFEKLNQELPSATYQREEAKRRIVLEALGWSNDDFFALAEEMMDLEKEETLSEKRRKADYQEIREKIKQREIEKGILATAGKDWKGFSQEEKRYVFRCLAVLGFIYDLLKLCHLSERKELFLPAAEFFNSYTACQLIRAQQKAVGQAKELQNQGIDYHQIRPLPLEGLNLIIKKLLLKRPSFKLVKPQQEQE